MTFEGHLGFFSVNFKFIKKKHQDNIEIAL